MAWFNNLSLKYKFGSFVAIVSVLAVLMGVMLVNSVHSIQLLTNDITNGNTNSLYVKELQVTLLKISAAFTNLADLEEGIEDAGMHKDVMLQTIDVLIEGNKSSEASRITLDQLASYKDNFETFYQNSKKAAESFVQDKDRDNEEYFEQSDDRVTKIIVDTELLVAQYLVMGKQHADHAIKSLGIIRNGGLTLLTVLMSIIIGASMLLLRSINTPVSNFIKLIKDMTQDGWDLTVQFENNRKDEFGSLASFFNQFVSTLSSVILEVTSASHELSTAAENLSQMTTQSKRVSTQQRERTEQIATAVNEMSAALNEVSTSTANAATFANNAAEESVKGRKIVFDTITAIELVDAEVNKALEAITQSKQESDSIGSIVDVIQGIAEQTNLLALNAAIEAARAGEQGRGFAVVADEVRTLANRTKQSTDEIQEMVERLQAGAAKATLVMEASAKKVESSVETASNAGTSLDLITKLIANINDLNSQIASATEEQLTVFENVNENIHAIQSNAEYIEESSRQSDAASNSLKNTSSNLQVIVGQFSV